ncbi:MAG: type IV secretion system protein VirB3 [Alphaproteobacteria bacterium CG11_big_fil_rev_8_21_14_0_20_39_49]|nr:MAG: type IV secretion system protein VirB3 [Alphaproteobacteria bacterium CG11_big_fil_rev_8_21_14_0_20_39_49]
METGELETDMLFLGLTRPSMIFGVSYLVVMTYFLIGCMGFVLTSDFKFFGGMLPIHCVAYVLSEKEPLFMELFMVKQQKCNKCKNKFYHGLTNSYDVM